jgi:hypothetical protein
VHVTSPLEHSDIYKYTNVYIHTFALAVGWGKIRHLPLPLGFLENIKIKIIFKSVGLFFYP